MSATIQDVRVKVRDTTEPYDFSDEDISEALTDAADWIEVQDVPASCPKYNLLQKLVAARSLNANPRTPRRDSLAQTSQITEGGKSVSYAVVDTTAMKQAKLDADISDVLTYCKGRAGRKLGGIGVMYDNY